MKRFKIIIILLITIVLSSCSHNKADQIVIALSKGIGSEHYHQYAKWLKSFDSTIIIYDLYYLSSTDSIRIILEQADGLLLTGGPDVHPAKYGSGFDTLRCDIDPHRDSVEFLAIELATKRKMPVLGICRGLQILNIYFGGTLFVDIPDDLGTKVIHRDDSSGYCFHNIKLNGGTRFIKTVGKDSYSVNSFHHQGINTLSDKFIITSEAEDGLPESIEWKSDERFISAVQWHPEREELSGFSRPLGRAFIDYCHIFRKFRF
jgi:putative glutamine amidotransferase